AFAQVQRAKLGAAQLRRVRQYRFEHGLKLAWRAGDHTQHLRGRGLPIQRLAQLVEQARVLDGDDSLRGEVLDQLDLLVGERADSLAIDDNAANQLILLEHWHLNKRAR